LNSNYFRLNGFYLFNNFWNKIAFEKKNFLVA
ncbi:uncharacterized protein METZ01_LOCUS376418, partial [marine metagenome]